MWTTWALPFYPGAWPIGLALLAGAAVFLHTRAGLALTLAIPILPLGNYSAGAAVVYTVAALALLALSWREPRTGLFLTCGPLLAPIAALGLLPLVALTIRSPVRRAAQVALAVLAAGLVAGIRGSPLPFDGTLAPGNLGLAASGDPVTVLSTLREALAARPALWVETLVLAAVAVLLPFARARGPWALAILGAAFLAAALLAVPAVAAAPIAVAVWATCVAVAVR
jgi:hypothetical protein